MSAYISDPGHEGSSPAHTNPMFDYLTGFVPRKLKDLFRWTEYLYYDSPHIFTAQTKMSEYVLTDITVTHTNKDLIQKYKEFQKLKKVVSTLKACIRDRGIYGNAFVTNYFPFSRSLTCQSCKSTTNVTALKYKFDTKKLHLSYDCLICDAPQTAHVDDFIDQKLKDVSKINVVRLDPKRIDIEHNPISGESTYYYNPSTAIRNGVKKGKPEFINTLPTEFIKAACDESGEFLFRFAEDQIFHMKIDAPAGVDVAWGFPPLTSVLRQFYYTKVLRKANEAIALDHLVPFRVLHPAQTGANNDPAASINLARWVDETESSLRRHRTDPLHIMFSPVALGVTQLGGQGRTLMTLGEVQAAEENIMAGMGLPREFFYGGLSYTGSSVTLRMIENQFMSVKLDVDHLVQWLYDKVGDYMGWDRVKAELLPFKLVDDVQQKGMLIQFGKESGWLSDAKQAQLFDIDAEEQWRVIEEESLDRVRRNARMEQAAQKLQTSLAAEAAQAAQSTGAGLNYDQQAVIAEADALVDQLMQMDEGLRKSNLHALQTEDMVMYAVVIQRLEQAQTTSDAEMRAGM